jgi:hypothetical protein
MSAIQITQLQEKPVMCPQEQTARMESEAAKIIKPKILLFQNCIEFIKKQHIGNILCHINGTLQVATANRVQ